MPIPTAVWVHAAAVGWQGRGIVVPGRSMTGKSTLAKALVDAGADYFSDEWAVIDEQGRLHPVPRPILLRRDGSAAPGTVPYRPQRIGSEPIPIHLIVATRYEPGVAWSPEVVTGARAALPLVDNAVAARTVPILTLEVAALVANGSTCLQGPRPDATTVALSILEAAQDRPS